jgi:hypothetical protein
MGEEGAAATGKARTRAAGVRSARTCSVTPRATSAVVVSRVARTGTLGGLDPEAVDSLSQILRAQAAGPVEHFGFESSGLIDLYRQLLAP